MAEYYLISQLPSLDGMSENTPIPITEERFLELCSRFLSKKDLLEIEKITLVPPVNAEKSNSTLIEAWNEGESNLRLALAKIRAEKMNKPFDLKNKSVPVGITKAANDAMELQSPLEVENFLLNYRLKFLEALSGKSQSFVQATSKRPSLPIWV